MLLTWWRLIVKISLIKILQKILKNKQTNSLIFLNILFIYLLIFIFILFYFLFFIFIFIFFFAPCLPLYDPAYWRWAARGLLFCFVLFVCLFVCFCLQRNNVLQKKQWKGNTYAHVFSRKITLHEELESCWFTMNMYKLMTTFNLGQRIKTFLQICFVLQGIGIYSIPIIFETKLQIISESIHLGDHLWTPIGQSNVRLLYRSYSVKTKQNENKPTTPHPTPSPN